MPKMDFKAVIDLVKYTLAFSAACFAYTLETLVPAPNDAAKWYVLAVLSLFVVSVLCGIFMFSSATAALHGDVGRAIRQKAVIKKLSFFHLGCLTLGVLLLGGKLVVSVLTEKPTAVSASSSTSQP